MTKSTEQFGGDFAGLQKRVLGANEKVQGIKKEMEEAAAAMEKEEAAGKEGEKDRQLKAHFADGKRLACFLFEYPIQGSHNVIKIGGIRGKFINAEGYFNFLETTFSALYGARECYDDLPAAELELIRENKLQQAAAFHAHMEGFIAKVLELPTKENDQHLAALLIVALKIAMLGKTDALKSVGEKLLWRLDTVIGGIEAQLSEKKMDKAEIKAIEDVLRAVHDACSSFL